MEEIKLNCLICKKSHKMTFNNNPSRDLNEIELIFKSLIKNYDESLKKANSDLSNKEEDINSYFDGLEEKVYFNKLIMIRENKLLKIEDMLYKGLISQIRKFKISALKSYSELNDNKFINSFKEIKDSYEKWSKYLQNGCIIDQQLIDQIRNSISILAVEILNLKNYIFNGKQLKFKNVNTKGNDFMLFQAVSFPFFEMISVSTYLIEANNFWKYDLTNKLLGLNEDENEEEYDDGANEETYQRANYHCTGIQSFGSLFVIHGESLINNAKNENNFFKNSFFVDIALKEENNIEIYRTKRVFVAESSSSCVVASNKICISYQNDYDSSVIQILDCNLETLHELKDKSLNKLVGANNSLVFMKKNQENLKIYNWSLQFLKEIGQMNDPELLFYIPQDINEFKSVYGKYFFMVNKTHFKIVNEQSGQLLKTIDCKQFLIDKTNFNLILICESSIKYLSFYGDLLKEFEFTDQFTDAIWGLDDKNRIFCYKESNKMVLGLIEVKSHSFYVTRK
jgi:hypothetical protein